MLWRSFTEEVLFLVCLFCSGPSVSPTAQTVMGTDSIWHAAGTCEPNLSLTFPLVEWQQGWRASFNCTRQPITLAGTFEPVKTHLREGWRRWWTGKHHIDTLPRSHPLDCIQPADILRCQPTASKQVKINMFCSCLTFRIYFESINLTSHLSINACFFASARKSNLHESIQRLQKRAGIRGLET